MARTQVARRNTGRSHTSGLIPLSNARLADEAGDKPSRIYLNDAREVEPMKKPGDHKPHPVSRRQEPSFQFPQDLVAAARLVGQLRDGSGLDRLLDRFPLLRERPDYLCLRADCNRYLLAIRYLKAYENDRITLVNVSRIAGASYGKVVFWLRRNVRPRLLRILERVLFVDTVLKSLRLASEQSAVGKGFLFGAADNQKGRPFPSLCSTSDTVGRLLLFRQHTPNARAILAVHDSDAYQEALRAHPLISSHPRFQSLHREVCLYFRLLQERLRNPSISGKRLILCVKKQTGYCGSSHTMEGWMYRGVVPDDVKLALSEGYAVTSTLLSAYPRLRRYYPAHHS